MYRKINITPMVAAVLSLAAMMTSEAFGETRNASSDCNFKRDSIGPYIVFKEEVPEIMRSQEAEDHGPIMDRKYRINCRYINDENVNEVFIVPRVEALVEYADGLKVEASKELTGALGVGDMMLSYSGLKRDHLLDYISANKYRKLPTESDPVYEVSIVSENEMIDNGDFKYEILKNATSLNHYTFIGAEFFVDEYGNSNDLSVSMDYLRQEYIKQGGDPNNFGSLHLRYHPAPTLYIEGLNYKGKVERTFATKMSFGLFGFIYMEGGFGENCKLCVTSEPPVQPTSDVKLTHLGKTGKYMDAWRIESRLETSQYGITYITSRDDTFYLPYPTTEETKESARAAGYDVP